MTPDDCALCSGQEADADLARVEVWADELWRLTTSVGPGDPIPGFSYLEPKRHVADITALTGPEAATFGPVIARCTRALKDATGAELVYVYIFGGHIPHLHVHLAPHRSGDALNAAMIKGEMEEQSHPSGVVMYVSKDYPPVPLEQLRAVADQIHQLLAPPGR